MPCPWFLAAASVVAVLVTSCGPGVVGETTATRFPAASAPVSSGAVTQPAASVAASLPSTNACAGRDPHEHVYHPNRLVLIEPCKTATGVVAFTRREADGDWHIGLRLDAGQESLLNARNISEEQGTLIVEIVCALPITQADAVAACVGYTNTIPVPAVGAHITVTGPFVLDADHGWREIHPVWSLTG